MTKQFISCIVKERVATILGSSGFMSILTGRSQVQKTGSDKWMALIPIKRNGEFSVHLYL